MNWERKALETIIWLLVEEDKKRKELLEALENLRISVDVDGTAFSVLNAVMDDQWLAENLEGCQDGTISKEEYISMCLEFIEEKFK